MARKKPTEKEIPPVETVNPVELYRNYRPNKFKDVIGQDAVVESLFTIVEKEKIPQVMSFYGPSGTGKTTLARIMINKIGIHPDDVEEINAASTRGIDVVREIQNYMRLASLGGKGRAWVFDEAHQLTVEAQTALLKTLEDTPPKCYFILCSTHPQKIIPTLRGRCQETKLSSIAVCDLITIVDSVVKKEGKQLNGEVMAAIAEAADGSARNALQILGRVIDITDKQMQMDAVVKTDLQKQAIDLCRMLMQNAPWKDIARFLKDFNEDPESFRYMMLSYAMKPLLDGRMDNRACAILNAFRDNYYDSKKAGLVLSCLDVCTRK